MINQHSLLHRTKQKTDEWLELVDNTFSCKLSLFLENEEHFKAPMCQFCHSSAIYERCCRLSLSHHGYCRYMTRGSVSWRLVNWPRMTTLNSALSDPTLFSATTLYLPVASPLVFLTVSREKVPSPSTLTSRPDLISVSLRHHVALGVGAPMMLTLRISDLPALIFCVSFSESLYSITGPAAPHHITSHHVHITWGQKYWTCQGRTAEPIFLIFGMWSHTADVTVSNFKSIDWS